MPGAADAVWGRLGRLDAKRWALLLALVALTLRLPFAFGRHDATPGGDSAGYLRLAAAIADGRGFGAGYRTPGYPLLIAAVRPLPGRAEDAVVAIQHLIGASLVAAIVLVAWRFFGRGAAVIAGAMAAVTPALVYVEHAILTDFAFAVVILAGAVALAHALEHPDRLRPLIVTGSIFGVAALIRPVGQFLLLAAPIALGYGFRAPRAVLRGSLVVGLSMLIVVAPWIVRNAIAIDRPTMSVMGGDTLFARAFEVDHLTIPTDTENGRLVAAAVGSQPNSQPLTVAASVLARRGYSRLEALDAERRLAVTAIRRAPRTYLGTTVTEVGRMSLDSRVVGQAENAPRNDTFLRFSQPGHSPLPTRLSRVVWRATKPLAGLWWLLSLHGFAGLLVLLVGNPRARRAFMALAAVWLAVALGTALGRGALTRYAIELAPITWILGSAGAAIVIGALRDAYRASRAGPGAVVS
jgi:4-amino-4-deoxy-L-arabinose transferase-like glycosyltransferase